MPSEVERELLACLPRLFSYAVSLSGDRDAARDLLQDCAVKALAAVNPPASGPALRAWLFRILRNAWVDIYRRKLRAPFEAIPVDDAAGTEYWRGDERLIHEIAVRQALDQLSVVHREVIVLVDLAGFTYADVATILDVPSGTVMSRLARARKALLATISDSNIRPFRATGHSDT